MGSSKRKKVCMGLMVALFLASGLVYAHGPKAVTLALNSAQDILKVKVTHSVKNPEKHYIKRIRVYVNKELVEEKFYKRQENESGQSDEFKLKNLKSGDLITVKAACNRFGGKKARITVK